MWNLVIGEEQTFPMQGLVLKCLSPVLVASMRHNPTLEQIEAKGVIRPGAGGLEEWKLVLQWAYERCIEVRRRGTKLLIDCYILGDFLDLADEFMDEVMGRLLLSPCHERERQHPKSQEVDSEVLLDGLRRGPRLLQKLLAESLFLMRDELTPQEKNDYDGVGGIAAAILEAAGTYLNYQEDMYDRVGMADPERWQEFMKGKETPTVFRET